MKRYMLPSVISLCCLIGTMQLETAQQPPRPGLSPEQVYKDLSPVQQTPSTFTTRLTFLPRNIAVEQTTPPVDNRPSAHPSLLQNEIQVSVVRYYLQGIQDHKALAEKVFKKIVYNYRIDMSATNDVKTRIQNSIDNLSFTSIQDTLKTFIDSKIISYRNTIPNPRALNTTIYSKMLETFNLIGDDRIHLFQFAINYLNQEITKLLPTPTPRATSPTTPTISVKLTPNQAVLDTFIATQMNDHYARIQRGEDAVPEEFSLPDYLNFSVENDVREAYDFSGPNQRLQSYALTQIDLATQALAEELEKEASGNETTPVITSPVTNIPPVATALPAPHAERMAQTSRPEEFNFDITSPVGTTNHPQATGFGSLAHPRLSPTTTQLEPSSAIPDFSIEPSPTMSEQRLLVPDENSLLNFIQTQIQALRPHTNNLQELSYAVEDQIFNTFDFSGSNGRIMEAFAGTELDLAINDLINTADLEPSSTTSESSFETQAHPYSPSQHTPSMPIAIAAKEASQDLTDFEPHSFRPKQRDEYAYESTLPTTPSLKTSTAARTLLNQVAQNIIQQQPTIQTNDLKDILLSVADENELDNYNQIITEITANRTQQLQAERQAALNRLRNAYAGSSDPRRLLLPKPDKSKQ